MAITIRTSEQKYDSEAKLADRKAVGDDSAWPEQDGRGGYMGATWGPMVRQWTLEAGLFLWRESVPSLHGGGR